MSKKYSRTTVQYECTTPNCPKFKKIATTQALAIPSQTLLCPDCEEPVLIVDAW